MSEREAFDRILASLHEAALDRERWSTAAGLIDDALRTHGSSMTFGGGPPDENARVYFAWCIMRGERHRELERAYFGQYFRHDERVPRVQHLPDSQLFHNTQLYTEQEMKTSATYNELLIPHHAANAVTVRLDGPNGTRIAWAINDPLDGDGWSSAPARLDPGVSCPISVRPCASSRRWTGPALWARRLRSCSTPRGWASCSWAGAGGSWRRTTAPWDVLRRGDGLFDEHGFLHARSPEDDAELQGLLRRALPPFGAQGAGGSTTLRRASGPRLVLHVSPVGRRKADARIWPVAALVLVIDPASKTRIDPAVAAAALGLTPNGEPGGGAVGRRQDRPRGGRGDGPPGKHDPHAREAHVRQASPDAAGGPGAACALAGRRSQVPALKGQAAADRR